MSKLKNNVIFLPLVWSFFALICLLPQRIINNGRSILPEKPIVVVIASYKNESIFKKNIDSVLMQEYKNYRIIYIADDYPTGNVVQEYIRKLGQQERIQLIINDSRRGKMANIYDAIHTCDNKDIIIDLDGDDWLKDECVFSYINSVYQTNKVVITFGQFETYPSGNKGFCRKIPEEVIACNGIRSYEWISSHLRTFYAGLFKRIKRNDFMYNGDFYQISSDQAFMLPMLEMAGRHTYFIDKILYVYNQANQLNDFRVDPHGQFHIAQLIRSKEKYMPLTAEQIERLCS